MTAWAFSANNKTCNYRYFLLFTHYDSHRANILKDYYHEDTKDIKKKLGVLRDLVFLKLNTDFLKTDPLS